MKILIGKKILILGVYNKNSIAYGIAKSLNKQGAKIAFTYQKKKNKNKIKKYLKKFNSKIILQCNLLKTKNIKKLVNKISKKWKKIDGVIHSIAYTLPNKFEKNYIESINKKNFLITHQICSYSFLEIIKYIKPLLKNNASLLTITYIGSKMVIPNYNIMGPAKASLETNIKYMAYSMKKTKIRVNAISSGIIPTVSSRYIKNFNKIKKKYDKKVIINNVTSKDIGNAAIFLMSKLSSKITGEIIHVDGGFHIQTY